MMEDVSGVVLQSNVVGESGIAGKLGEVEGGSMLGLTVSNNKTG